MPYLRFTRDTRGYENTYLVHTATRHGKPLSRLLYWFRTPPNVRIGRAALDEGAIRLIEEMHPDVEFDWPQILKTPIPMPPPAPFDGFRKGRRPSTSTEQSARADEALPPVATRPDEPPAGLVPDVEPIAFPAPPEPPEALGISDTPPHVNAVEALIGSEGLARVRARYAELLVRIGERPLDPALREALLLEAATVDPDRWVTEAEAREGLEHLEARTAALVGKLGGRRARFGRGGRRRRRVPGEAVARDERGAGSADAARDGEDLPPSVEAFGQDDDQ